MLGKNAVVTVRIEDMSSEGQGVGTLRDESTGGACGFVLFVKDAIIGDLVLARVTKVKKTYGYARVEKVLEPSPHRCEALCPVARQCGGCQLQEMDYQAQLEFKQRKVENNILRLGGLNKGSYEMLPIVGMDNPYRYRNKAQFPVGEDSQGNVRIGFYAGRTHHIVEQMDCIIGDERNEGILRVIKAWMEQNHIRPYDEATGRGLVRHILIRIGRATDELGVCIVINGDRLDHVDSLVSGLAAIPGMVSVMVNENSENTNVILGKECRLLYGKPYIEDMIGDVRYRISPLSFYQVNPVQTRKMYDTVVEFAGLTGKETVWDLYCGIGTISLYIAGNAEKVYGVEVIPAAVDNARDNAKLNGIGNVEFFLGKAEDVVPEFYERESGDGAMLHPDVMVVDPPRKGCDPALIDTMLKMSPKRIVYVSCDSATLGRDLKLLCGSGEYELVKVRCFDNFCQGVHVETVVLLSRKAG